MLALAFVPPAAAWTKVSPATLDNAVDPSVVLADGKEYVAYREPKARAVVVEVDGKPGAVVKGLASVGDPQLLALPNGALLLLVADQAGVVTYSVGSNGRSVTGPAKTASTDTGDVQAAAVRKDGTWLFSQDGTDFVNLFAGATGAAQNLFAHCCGYAESLAVDSHGVVQVAFWSNASGYNGYLYARLGAGGAVAGGLKKLSTGAETAERANRVPLVADALGDTFTALANGYPAANDVVVDTLRGGSIAHSVTLAKGTFTGDEPLLALAVDDANRLWAVWTQAGAVWAARSRSHGAHFGATVHLTLPGSAYALEAGARPDGSVDAIVNNGSALVQQRLLPGLTVQPVAHGVRVLDDGFPVAGAVVHGGGKTVTTGASGAANLGTVASHTAVAVTAAGYTPASGVTG